MSRLPFLFIASAKANCMHKYLIFLFTHKYVCACARRPQFPHFTLANFCEVINKTFKKRWALPWEDERYTENDSM